MLNLFLYVYNIWAFPYRPKTLLQGSKCQIKMFPLRINECFVKPECPHNTSVYENDELINKENMSNVNSQNTKLFIASS